MRRRFFVAISLALVLSATVPLFAYRAFEQITVGAASVGFTASLINSGSGHPQATWAVCAVRTAAISYRTDGGTPTATVGTVGNVGDVLSVTKREDVVNFRAIRVAASGQLDCTYGGE